LTYNTAISNLLERCGQIVENNDAERPDRGVYQPPLFEGGGRARLLGHAGQINDLTPTSSLDIARYWFRRYLEQSGYPKNTVDSYSYDLSILNSMIGSKRINQIHSRDIAQYLDASLNRSTRKRRLTSVSRFFRYLIAQAQVLDRDPAQSFHPDPIPLKTPKPLFMSEQEQLLEAAEQDGPRAHAIVWLFLNLGLTRAELLRLRKQDIDLTDPAGPVIYIFYDSPRYAGKERKLAAGAIFAPIYERLLARLGESGETLFEMLPQSVNRLVERVAGAAGISKAVSPQSLRDTFAVNQARNGLDEKELLELLGLANDARNRVSVQRYIKLAKPPLQPGRPEAEDSDVELQQEPGPA
jgi:integrase/recombinase XerD